MKNKSCPGMHKTKSLKLHCFSLTFKSQTKTHEKLTKKAPSHLAQQRPIVNSSIAAAIAVTTAVATVSIIATNLQRKQFRLNFFSETH